MLTRPGMSTQWKTSTFISTGQLQLDPVIMAAILHPFQILFYSSMRGYIRYD